LSEVTNLSRQWRVDPTITPLAQLHPLHCLRHSSSALDLLAVLELLGKQGSISSRQLSLLQLCVYRGDPVLLPAYEVWVDGSQQALYELQAQGMSQSHPAGVSPVADAEFLDTVARLTRRLGMVGEYEGLDDASSGGPSGDFTYTYHAARSSPQGLGASDRGFAFTPDHAPAAGTVSSLPFGVNADSAPSEFAVHAPFGFASEVASLVPRDYMLSLLLRFIGWLYHSGKLSTADSCFLFDSVLSWRGDRSTRGRLRRERALPAAQLLIEAAFLQYLEVCRISI